MALHRITDFTSEVIKKRNWARKYNFAMHFTSPIMLQAPEKMFIRCESMVIPGQNIATSVDDIRVGPSREHAIGKTVAPVQATFICSHDLIERKYFEVWQHNMVDRRTFQVSYHNDYVTDIYVEQYNDRGRLTFAIKLIDAYPKGIVAQEVALSSNETEFMRVSVELGYHVWRHLGEFELSQLRRKGKVHRAEVPEGDVSDKRSANFYRHVVGDAPPGGTRQSTPIPGSSQLNELFT